jgi:hypothetical protein
MILSTSNNIKLAPIRIIKEEGKEETTTKSRPRRRSTLKKEKVKAAIDMKMLTGRRRRSKRIQEGLKRNSRDFWIANVLCKTIKEDDEEEKSLAKDTIRDNSIEVSNSYERSKTEKKSKITDKESIRLLPSTFMNNKRDDVLTDNECNSLKIPSLKEFNLSNASYRANSKLGQEEKLSDSSLSNRVSHWRIPMNFWDNLTENEFNEAVENFEKLSNSNKKNSITDFFNLKRLSQASLFLHNHFNMKEMNIDTMFNRENSNNSLERNPTFKVSI